MFSQVSAADETSGANVQMRMPRQPLPEEAVWTEAIAMDSKRREAARYPVAARYFPENRRSPLFQSTARAVLSGERPGLQSAKPLTIRWLERYLELLLHVPKTKSGEHSSSVGGFI